VRTIATLLALVAVGSGTAAAAGDEPHLQRTRLQGYERTRDPRAVRVVWITNSAFDLTRVRVREGRRRVVVTVIERVPGGVVTMMAEQRVKLVKLSRPLGTRALIDGASGKRSPPP
jgi:hypothetical protein